MNFLKAIPDNQISPQDKSIILQRVKGKGELLWRYLILNNYLSPNETYQLLATYNQTPFFNSIQNSQNSLLHFAQFRNYIEYHTYPIEYDPITQQYLFVIDYFDEECNISSNTIDWIENHYGKNYKFITVTPSTFKQHIEQVFKTELLHDAQDSIYDNHTEYSIRNTLSSGLLISCLSLLSFFTIGVLFLDSITIILYILLNLTLIANGVFKLYNLVSIIQSDNFFSKYNLKNSWYPSLNIKCNNKFHNLYNINDHITNSLLPKHTQKNFIEPEIEIEEYPTYTILIPLYKENISINNLLQTIHNFRYPQSKIFIKILIEENDHKTLDIVNFLNQEYKYHYELLIIPNSPIKTKPKACNYALHFIDTKYLTIYDAEDIPDVFQLQKSLHKFQSNPNLSVVQAKLGFYNANENPLTLLFFMEYQIWFNINLQSIKNLDLPIPLGGTSYHIKTQLLKDNGGLDAYNVTEDAELGVRYFHQNHEIDLINSTTLEECPINIIDWLKQRSRWIKGYMQLLLIHLMHIKQIYKEPTPKKSFGLIFIIMMPAISYQLTLILLLLSFKIYYYNIEINNIIYILATCNIITWLSVTYFYLKYLYQLHNFNKNLIIKTYYLFPFYWLLHILASYLALIDLIFRPFYWSKTTHGVSKTTK